MNRLYEKLNIPDKCLYESTIFKKSFLDNADLLSADKKIINDHIKKVIWKYCLKPDTINILPYQSAERDYLEIEIIEVQLNETSKVKRIAEIIMRAIPYPIVLIFNDGANIQLATGDMRKNLSDSSKVTVDDFVYTDWIDLNQLDEFSNKLLSELDVTKMSSANYFTLYKDITAKLNYYNISRAKGELISEDNTTMSTNDIKECYDRINALETQVMALKSKIKKAGSIKEKVELNMQVDNLKKEIDTLKSKI